jgi:hypothetical protein
MIKGEFFIIKLFNKYIQDEDNSLNISLLMQKALKLSRKAFIGKFSKLRRN